MSGSKSWSNKGEVAECGGQSVIQAVLETNHAGSWGHFFLLLLFLLRALVQFCHDCTRNQVWNLKTNKQKEVQLRGSKNQTQRCILNVFLN